MPKSTKSKSRGDRREICQEEVEEEEKKRTESGAKFLLGLRAKKKQFAFSEDLFLLNRQRLKTC